MDFWAAGANFGPLSKILYASNRAAIAELAKKTSCCKQILDFSHVCNAFADFLTVALQ